MKIRFVCRGRLGEWQGECEEDLLFFGFDGMGEVSYEKELRGESVYFEEAALLSKTTKATVVCGCITDTRGHKRKSAVVAENGKICGVSDMLNAVDGRIGCGAGLRIYDTNLGRMGVVVAEDIHFPEVVKTLSLCGSDFIVCPYGRVISGIERTLLCAYAYCYGTPILFCGVGYCMLAEGDGKLAFASPEEDTVFCFENSKEYHIIENLRRGFFGG